MLEASRAITKVSVMERLNDHLLGDCQKLDEIKKNGRTRSCFWSVFIHIRKEYGKYGPENFHIWTLFTKCIHILNLVISDTETAPISHT